MRKSMSVIGWRRELWSFLYNATDEQVANVLTKLLSRMKFG